MTSLNTTNRRVGSLFAVAAFVLATVTPGLVPAFASAAQVTERSVELSSSSKGATGVTYNINFTTVSTTAPASVVLEFCNDTPLIGAACTAPTGFDVSSTSATGYTIESTTTAADNRIVVSGTFAAEDEVTIPLTGVSNPSNAGALYVRILTYNTNENAKAYTSTSYETGLLDQGSAAVSITDTVGVSAAVLESMTFCVSGKAIEEDNCGGVTSPVLKLGEGDEGEEDALALSSTAVSTGDLYSQISTNAASGAVVSLKSATTCGGLKRATATSCDIAAAGSGGVTAGQAKFGLTINSAANPGTGANSSGTYQIYNAGEEAYYSDTVFKFNYDSSQNTGVTSPYGDAILDTASQPVNNKNVMLTFGVSASNTTPAGLYSTDLSLIATGKF